MAVPTYIIYRDTPAGEPFDPTAAPVFFPPKDSDELFDALRAKFPNVKSHSERMRDAMIEFLIEEHQAAQSEQMPITAADLLDVDISTASSFQQSWPSMSSGSTSVFSSPDTLDLATPSFTMSPQIKGHQLSRFPTTTSTTAASPTSSNTSPFTSAREGTSPQPLEQMTGVFSVSSSAQPKQRVRRKMTEAEKAEYRKRRIVKACDKCQKRKRKCNHNQPEMDYLAANQKVKKANKQRPQAQILNQASWGTEMNDKEFEMNFGFDPSMFGSDMQLFEDDLTLLQEPWSFGQQSQSQQTGVAPTVNRGGWDQQRPMQDFESVFGVDHHNMSHEGMGMEATTGGRNLQTATSMNNANASNAQLFGQLHNQDQRGHSDQPETIQQRSGGTGNRMLWEHLRTGQAEPAHTSHVHEPDNLGSYVLDDSGTLQDTVPPSPSWSSAVLQVTGTLKAIKAFGRLASSPSARTALQSVPMSKATAFISTRNSQEVNAQQGRSVHTSRAVRHTSLPSTLATKKVFGPTCASALAGAPLSWASRDGSQDGLRLEVEGLLNTTHNRLPHGSVSAAATSSSSRSSKELASTSALVSESGSLFEKESDSAHDQGRPDWDTIGEGIDRLPSPSKEMFMLRRRIPKALHSIVDRDNCQHNAFATANPVLQTHIAFSALSGHNDDPEPFAGGDKTPSKGSNAAAGNNNLASASEVGIAAKATTSHSQSECTDSTASFQSYAQDRLSDHVTYRDHFGRSTNALAVLAGSLLLASLLFRQIQAVSPSLLVLALVIPDYGWRHLSSCLFRGLPVQCTTKNSSWLGSLLVLSSSRSKSEYVSKGPVEDRGGRGCLMWC